MTGGPRVLGPYELHNNDIAPDATVRQRILSDYYRFGQALPTGLLSEEFLLTTEQVTRAVRRLVRNGWVRRDPVLDQCAAVPDYVSAAYAGVALKPQ
ncbi:hypothetical protein AB0C90_40390 [Streptomyces sp. NPDC048550]|uniref:hypothetical protein n=1 Tax=Streptomyces sp. NPDC048550 TaxID=3155739 RepID=UPI0034124BC0